jgi:uncharacterized membrane protein
MVFALLHRASQKWVFWVLVDVLIFLVFALVALRYYPAQAQMKFQLDLALKILHGQVPYVDFTSEYPPLALLSFLLPALLFRSPLAYHVAFTVEVLLFDLLAMAFIARIGARLGISLRQALSVHALVILGVGPIVAVMYDIIPAALVLAALFFFMKGKSSAAWALVGLGLMTKLYPIIVAPFFVLYHLRQMRYKEIAKGVVIFAAVVLALSLPWLLLNAGGFWGLFTYHLERGLHSESVYGSLLLLGKILGLVQVEGVYNFGSWNLYSPLADGLARFSFIIMAGLLGIVYVLYSGALLRGPGKAVAIGGLPPEAAATLLRYVTAAVLVFLLSAKVFSAQYLVWLCPLLPLVTGRWRVPLLTCFVVAGVFSQFIFPYYYQQFEVFQPPLVVMMAARNLLLLLGLAFVLLPGERRPAGGPQLKSFTG